MLKGDNLVKIILTVLLSVVSFFVTQTYFSIKSLEKDVVTIRVKLAELETSRITRSEIREIVSEYHNSHPFNQQGN